MIYHLPFPSQYLLTSTLMRMQEFYESPKYKGKTFTHEEYMDWYATTRGGEMSYFTDWSGFNIPSWVFGSFEAGDFDPLSKKESELLSLLGGLQTPFYLIATCDRTKKATLAHEIVHGLFYMQPDYATSVAEALGNCQIAFAEKVLSQMGYHKSVWLDELNAYSLTGYPDGIDKIRAAPIRRVLLQTFRDHFDFSPASRDGQARLLEMVTPLRWE